jgi:multidrug efflux pump subunit AcrA (membrane-fusion protein)
VVLPLAVLLLALGLLAYAAQDTLLPRREVRVVPVVVKTGVESSAGVTVQAPGWLEPDPYPVAVSALTDGIVKDVLVLEGEVVKKGQVVARLVDDDARLARDRAAAALAEKRAARDAAQRQWDNPVERKRAVEVADAMAEETRAELKKLESDVAAEVATSEELKEEYARRERLRETSAAAGLEIVQAQRRYESQLARLAAAKAQKPVLEQKLRQREADAVAAREHLRLRIEEAEALAEAKAAADVAEVAWQEACLRLDRTEIRSPTEGVVMTRLAEPGAKLMAASDHPQSAQAVRLYDPKRLQVRVDVPLADAARVGVGQEAKVVVHVLPDREFRGRVTRISGEADLAKNTLQVKVAVIDA